MRADDVDDDDEEESRQRISGQLSSFIIKQFVSAPSSVPQSKTLLTEVTTPLD